MIFLILLINNYERYIEIALVIFSSSLLSISNSNIEGLPENNIKLILF